MVALAPGDAHGFCDELDRIVRSNFTRDYWEISLPNRLDTSGAKSPVLLAYWAALNLLDAEVLFSRLKIRELLDPNVTAPRSIERHHLFPKKFLATKNILARSQVNAIANMAFVDWPENTTINVASPLEYWPTLTQGMTADQLDRQRYWHALPVGWEQLDYFTFLERRRSKIADVVKAGFETLCDEKDVGKHYSTVSDLIALGESQRVEFKSTARLNLYTGKVDKRMEHVVTKTVCGFLNAEGGTLLIGVDDDGQLIGLSDDMKTLGSKASRDGFELFLRQHLDSSLSTQTVGVVHIRFERHMDSEVCAVVVASSGRPVFAKPLQDGNTPMEFWVRTGNATKQLHGEEMLMYQSDHWG